MGFVSKWAMIPVGLGAIHRPARGAKAVAGRRAIMETSRRDEEEKVPGIPGRSPAPSVRHALRDQDALWDEFLAMGLAVVDSLSKSVAVLCEGHFEVVPEVKRLEEDSDRAEVRIEQECLRILAL